MDSDKEIGASKNTIRLSDLPILISVITGLALVYSVTYNFFFFRALDATLLELMSVSDHLTSALRNLPLLFLFYFLPDVAAMERRGAIHRVVKSANTTWFARLVGATLVVLFVALALAIGGIYAGSAVFAFVLLVAAASDVSRGLSEIRSIEPAKIILRIIVLWVCIAAAGAIGGAFAWNGPPTHIINFNNQSEPLEVALIRRLTHGSVVLSDRELKFIPNTEVIEISSFDTRTTLEKPFLCMFGLEGDICIAGSEEKDEGDTLGVAE